MISEADVLIVVEKDGHEYHVLNRNDQFYDLVPVMIDGETHKKYVDKNLSALLTGLGGALSLWDRIIRKRGYFTTAFYPVKDYYVWKIRAVRTSAITFNELSAKVSARTKKMILISHFSATVSCSSKASEAISEYLLDHYQG